MSPLPFACQLAGDKASQLGNDTAILSCLGTMPANPGVITEDHLFIVPSMHQAS